MADLDPRRRFHRNRFLPNFSPFHERSHGDPDSFRNRMRTVKTMSEEESSAIRSQHEKIATTESPEPEQNHKSQENTGHGPEQITDINDASNKLAGRNFHKQKPLKEDKLPNREMPWIRMHAGAPLRGRHSEIFDHSKQMPKDSGVQNEVHFSAGTGAEISKIEINTNEKQQSENQIQQPENTDNDNEIEAPTKILSILENNPHHSHDHHWDRFGARKPWDANLEDNNMMMNDFNDFHHERPAHFHRGHFFERFAVDGRGPMDAPLNIANRGRDDRETVIRMVNRPPDIIIRNTFQDRPKSFIDLRITIDDNGVLNVEAGPQGLVRAANATSNVNPNFASNHVVDQLDDDNERNDEDLESHWMRNRKMSHNLQHVSGLQAGHHEPMQDKKIPIWILNNPKLGTHRQRQKEQNNDRGSDLEGEEETKNQKSFREDRSQSKVMGPSHPPHIPTDKMRPAPEIEPETAPEEALQLQATDFSKVGARNSNDVQSAALEVEKMQNAEETIPEELAVEIKPVISIDDSSSTGCPSLTCKKQCPGGLSKLDQNSGCPSCDCCPEVKCRMSCAKGYESDQFGCPICKCVAN